MQALIHVMALDEKVLKLFSIRAQKLEPVARYS
jgi:hypothetical protein